MAAASVLPISIVISRPNSSASSSRISAARVIMRARSSNEVLRYSRKVSAASWIFLSISSSDNSSKVFTSSPVAGLTVDLATTILLANGVPANTKYTPSREPPAPDPTVTIGGPVNDPRTEKPLHPGDAKRVLQERACEAGFDLVGVARAEPLTEGGERLRSWQEAGMAADMGYKIGRASC